MNIYVVFRMVSFSITSSDASRSRHSLKSVQGSDIVTT